MMTFLFEYCVTIIVSNKLLSSDIFVSQEKTHNFWKASSVVEKAVKETEDKFATYWPRNILILFGPPGEP